MKQVTYQDIRKELIEVGIRARANFGPNLDHIRSHARDRGVTLTWGQESDVLLSAHSLYRTRLSELNADAGTVADDAAAAGLPYVRKSPIDFLLPHRWGRRKVSWRMPVFDAPRPFGNPERRLQTNDRQQQSRM